MIERVTLHTFSVRVLACVSRPRRSSISTEFASICPKANWIRSSRLNEKNVAKQVYVCVSFSFYGILRCLQKQTRHNVLHVGLSVRLGWLSICKNYKIIRFARAYKRHPKHIRRFIHTVSIFHNFHLMFSCSRHRVSVRLQCARCSVVFGFKSFKFVCELLHNVELWRRIH